MTRGAVGFLALSATLALAAPALAQNAPGPKWSLKWTAPEGCPSGTAVDAEVSSLLEGSKQVTEPLTITGVVSAQGDGFEASLQFDSAQFDSAHGPLSRTLNGRACKEVSKAAALVIALAIDPGVTIDPNRRSALETTPEPEPAEPKPEPVVAPAEKPKPKKQQPVASNPTQISIEGDLGGSAEAGTFPAVGLGLHGGLSFGVGAVRATITGEWFPAHNYNADQNTNLRMSLIASSLLLGYAVPFGAHGEHAVTPELGMRVGDLAARARDAAIPTSAHSLLLGPQLGVRSLLHATGPLGFWAGLGTGLNLSRPRLAVQNRGLAHQPSPIWGTLSLGISLRWP